MATIGFIGLGNMGGADGRQPLKAGHWSSGFDLAAPAPAASPRRAGMPPSSIAEAAAAGEIVITMLPAAGRMFGPSISGRTACSPALRRRRPLVDCSTIDVETARSVAAGRGGKRASRMLDAPVSGGRRRRRTGTLTFMVGGEDKDCVRAGEPILAAMGKTIVHAGPRGNGQAAEICNNMLLGISMIGVCEAFALAEKLGLDAQTFSKLARNRRVSAGL